MRTESSFLSILPTLALLASATASATPREVSLKCTPLTENGHYYNGFLPSSPAAVEAQLTVDGKDVSGSISADFFIPGNIESPVSRYSDLVVGGYFNTSDTEQYQLASRSNTVSFVLDLRRYNSSLLYVLDPSGKVLGFFITNCAKTEPLLGYESETKKIRDARVSNQKIDLKDVITGYDVACAKKTAQVDMKALCADPAKYMRKLLDQRSSEPCMRSAFLNGPYGLISGGVCWWHSTFQQQAWQLSTFSPNRPKPSPERLRELIAELYQGRSVVDFQGFHNWAEVSLVARDVILRIMMNRQLIDAMNPRTWGVWTMPKLTSKRLFEAGREIERNYSRGFSSFIYYRVGMDYHAKVAYRVKRERNRLLIDVIDSNVGEINEAKHTYSAAHFGNRRLVIVENADGTAKRVDDDFSEPAFENESWLVSHERFGPKAITAWQERCQQEGFPAEP